MKVEEFRPICSVEQQQQQGQYFPTECGIRRLFDVINSNELMSNTPTRVYFCIIGSKIIDIISSNINLKHFAIDFYHSMKIEFGIFNAIWFSYVYPRIDTVRHVTRFSSHNWKNFRRPFLCM